MTGKDPVDSINAGTQERMQDEPGLIRRAQSGDVQAFEMLVRHYQPRVLSLACSIVDDPADARDVAQEVFIRVYRFLPSFEHRKRFFTWLYRIILNCSYDFLKREKRFRHDPLDEAVIAGEAAPGEGRIRNGDLSEVITGLLGTLSVAQKTAFVLRDVEGLSCKEAAAIMDCPQGTLRSHLHFARRRLRDLLKNNYPEYLEGTGS
ncbi:sigma-70 family RNA polymerase sigma factor [bacterium]|nr:sigma-70 family RNA polymerase sigma factor [bacterium]